MKLNHKLLYSTILAAALTGCGSDSNSNTPDDTPDTQTPVVTTPEPKVETPKMIGTGVAFSEDKSEFTIEHDTEGYAATMKVRVTKGGFYKELSFESNIATITVSEINDAENGIYNIDVMSVATISVDSVSDPERPATLGNEVKTIFEAGSFEIRDGGFYQVEIAQIPNALGVGTMTPQTALHVSSGDTPTLRLEQNNSAGWSVQTWDIQANDAAFNVTNATNSATPFKVMSDAPDEAIKVNQDGVSIPNITGNMNLTNLDDHTQLSLTSPLSMWSIRNNFETGRLVIGNEITGINPIKIMPEAQENLVKFGFPTQDVVKVDGDVFIKAGDGNFVSLKEIVDLAEIALGVEFTHQ